MRSTNHRAHNRPRYAPEPLEPRTLLAAGALDTTFDGDGVATTNFHPVVDLDDAATEIAIQPDGKILAAGGPFRGGPKFAKLARFNPDGSFDPTFGDGGKLLSDALGTVRDLALLPDGRFLLAGSDQSSRGTVVRFRPDGTIDPTFDFDETVLSGRWARSNIAGAELLPDGRVVITGAGTNATAGPESRPLLARLAPGGALDPTFGDGASGVPGFVLLPDWGPDTFVSQLALGGDRIVLAGGGTLSPRGVFATRLTLDGRPDPSFAGGEPVFIRFFDSAQYWSSMTMQSGKVVLGGSAFDTANMRHLVLARLNDDGTLDATFGGDGKVTEVFDWAPGQMEDATALAVDAAGNLLAAGVLKVSRPVGVHGLVAGVVRYRADGSRDTSFGENGAAGIALGGRESGADAVALDAEGRIVIGGSAGNHVLMEWNFDLAVGRITPDGQSDLTFAGDGEVSTNFRSPFAARSYGNAAALQPDGKLIVGGSYYAPDTAGGAARFNPDGSIDHTFGDAGEFRFAPGSLNTVTDLKVLPDGKVLLLTDDGKLTRLVAGGRRDATFGANGTVTPPIGTPGPARPQRLLTQPDGKLLVAGQFFTGFDWVTSHAFIARLNADGTVDRTFGIDGHVSFWSKPEVLDLQRSGDGRVIALLGSSSLTSAQTLYRFTPEGRPDPTFGPGEQGFVPMPDPANSIDPQPDGRIVAAGAYRTGVGQNLDLVLRRFNPDGSPDATVGAAGRAVFDVGSMEIPDDLALQPDGAILVAGTDGVIGRFGTRQYDRSFVARFTPDGRRDATFGDNGVVWTRALTVAGLLRQPDGKAVVFGTAGTDVQQLAAARVHTDDAPRVAQLALGGSSWSPAFGAAVAPAAGAGAAPGFIVPPGTTARPLPWTNLDTVSVKFDRAVAVERHDLRVSGRNVATYPVVDFSYDPVTSVATWKLGRAIPADEVTVELQDAPATLQRRVDVLPGDVNGDGMVLADDLSEIRARFFRTARAPGAGPSAYSVFHDPDGSGVIRADDFAAVKARLFDVLPREAAPPPLLARESSVTRSLLGAVA
jgi:uncharacterized delta-60 repeat protein